MSVALLHPGQRVLTLGDLGTVTVRHGRAAAAAGANGLLNQLIAYWPGDEASGNLLDAHTNGLDLTDVYTVTNDTGHVYATARQYTRATTELHRRPGDDALLSMGDVDATFAAWMYLDSKPAGDMWLLTKWEAGLDKREYMVRWEDTLDRFQFYVRYMDNSTNTSVTAATFGAPSASTWYLILAYHDSVSNEIGISVNNGTVDTAAHTQGIRDSTGRFAVGADAGPGNYWDGRIGPSAMWKSAAGAGGVLSSAARTALWNGGAGLTYASFTT